MSRSARRTQPVGKVPKAHDPVPDSKPPVVAEVRTSRILPERIFQAIAAGLALWTLLTTLIAIYQGYFPLPQWDEWDLWQSYLLNHYSFAWFFQQHSEHRLVAPGLLFVLDHLVFDAREWSLLLFTFCFQCLTAFMLWRFFVRIQPERHGEGWIVGAAIVTALFSAQQYVNFIWGFQVQFILVYCAMVGSLFALLKSREKSPEGRDIVWIMAAIGCASVANYSMANGVLVWPLLLLASFWLGMRLRQILLILAGALLIGVPFFYKWHRPGQNPSPFASWAQLQRTALFWFANVGAPVHPLAATGGNESFAFGAAASIGAVLIVVTVLAYVRACAHRRVSSTQVALVHVCAFLLVSTLAIAIGRSADYTRAEAFTPRYFTPVYVLWACLFVIYWPVLRSIRRPILYGSVCLAIFATVAVHQKAMIAQVREWASGFRLGETAVAAGVFDPGAWNYVYHTPKLVIASVAYLKDHNISMFTEEWTHWPGLTLGRRFDIDPDRNSCQGQFESAGVVLSDLAAGWHVEGWAWDVKARRIPRYVILADDKGLVAGVALTGFPQAPQLAALASKYSGSPWHGYVSGAPRAITAYVLESNERSLCAIGTRQLPRSGTQAKFSELATPLPDGQASIVGSWVPDGFFPSVGRPPVSGKVFGSWAGADSNTGTLQLGPFHLDGHVEIAIPVVTGPRAEGQSLVIRDAVSKSVLAQMDPVPVRTDWWVWRPDFPVDRDMTIEIIAVDHGNAFGQWFAVGWPHFLQK